MIYKVSKSEWTESSSVTSTTASVDILLSQLLFTTVPQKWMFYKSCSRFRFLSNHCIFQSYSRLDWSPFGNCYGIFRRPDAFPIAQPTASKHWRMTVSLIKDSVLPPCCQDRSGTLWGLHGLPCPLDSKELPSCDRNSAPDLETANKCNTHSASYPQLNAISQTHQSHVCLRLVAAVKTYIIITDMRH